MKKFLLISAISFLSVIIFAIVVTTIFVLGSDIPQNVELIMASPSWAHIFGTDTLGRDLLLRILVGGRISLFVGIVCALLSFAIGFSVGSVSGWFEGYIDKIIMRVCEIFIAIPSFILVAVLCLFLQSALPFSNPHLSAVVGLCLGISATHWMTLARMTRGLVMEVKRQPYIEAAVALGGTRIHILVRHVFPNIAGTLLILIALQVPTAILYESFMSFIGLGVHPPYASWGVLVKEGWKALSSYPHLILFPSLILFLTVWSLHIILDWIGTQNDPFKQNQ